MIGMLMKRDVSVFCVMLEEIKKENLFLSDKNNLDCAVYKIQLIDKTGITSHGDINSKVSQYCYVVSSFNNGTR